VRYPAKGGQVVNIARPANASRTGLGIRAYLPDPPVGGVGMLNQIFIESFLARPFNNPIFFHHTPRTGAATLFGGRWKWEGCVDCTMCVAAA